MKVSHYVRATMVAAVVAASTAIAGAGPLPACATPALTAPAFAAGATNTVLWTQPSGALEGGGFILEVASSSARDGDGSLRDVEQSIGDIPSSARQFVLTGLSEGAHWYSIKAKTKSQTCSSSNWSGATISTIQDATGPTVTIESPSDEGHIYLLETVTVSGTLVDTGSGPGSVTVSLTNTTPALAETIGSPAALTVDATTGTWTATFEDVLPGTYLAAASGTDLVGNTSASAAQRNVIVTVTP